MPKRYDPRKDRAPIRSSGKIPAILVFVTRNPGAPRTPTRAQLLAVFSAALQLIPPQRNREALGRARLSVDVHLVSDTAISELNSTHMHHEGPTDVLSFPMNADDPQRKSFHVGEVVVSFETARREARERGLPVDEEILRYCVHGFLHCMGYDDSTPGRRRTLFAVQEKALGK